MSATTIAISLPKPPRQRIPDSLVRETINGTPFYYRGYRAVLAKQKSKEDIMAYSSLQCLILEYFTYQVLNRLDFKLYRVFIGDTGSHIEHRSNLSLDMAVFEKSKLTNGKIGNKCADVPQNW